MRVLGIDIGTKRIGIAVSDPLGWTAQGVEVWKHVSREADMARIIHWLYEYQATTIVIGMPKNMDGTKGEKALWTEQFAAELQTLIPDTKVVLWDERLTTVIAQRGLIAANVRREKRKQVVDKMAAAIILQGYLDSIR